MCDVQKIWSGLLADRHFANDFAEPRARELFRTAYIEKLPTILAHVLDQPVTLTWFAVAKLALSTHIHDNDLVGKIIPLHVHDSQEHLEKSLRLSRQYAASEVEKYTVAVAQAPKLARGRMTSELEGCHQAIRAFEKSTRRKAETLTIRQLLEQSPVTLIK